MHYFLNGNITLVPVKNPENKGGSLYIVNITGTFLFYVV